MSQPLSKITKVTSLVLLLPALLLVGAIWQPELLRDWQGLKQKQQTLIYSKVDKCTGPLKATPQADVYKSFGESMLGWEIVDHPKIHKIETQEIIQVAETDITAHPSSVNHTDRSPMQEEYQHWRARLNRVTEEIDRVLLKAEKEEESS